MPANSRINIYLPNLNAIRFIAALFVFIDHNQAVKDAFNIPHHPFPAQIIIGKLGVVLFFVLSGLLITCLLLREEEATRRIAIRNFYTRRVLRIWPLYFIIVAFALFAAPHTAFFTLDHFDSALNSNNLPALLLLFLFFLPNAVLSHFGAVPYASQTWSVGTEEQFYLLWPWLMRLVRQKGLLFPGVFIVYNLVKLLLILLQYKADWVHELLGFWYYFNIDCMALGAWAAYLVVRKQEKVLKLLFHPYVQWATYLLLAVLIITGVEFPYMHFEVYALLFAIALINLAFNPGSVLSLENKVLNYLGKISYGLYMYHFIALVITVRILRALGMVNGIAVFILGLFITIVMAAFSYRFIERYFLRLKSRFGFFDSREPSPTPAK